MSQEDDKRIFNILRPYCVNLSKLALAPPELIQNKSLETLNALKDVYDHFEESTAQSTKLSTNLADYIFVPLSYLLKQPHLPDNQINYILKILTLLIRHCWSNAYSLNFVLAKQLFPLITFLTGGSPNGNDAGSIKSKSDELKTSGAQTLNELFRSLAIQKSSKVYDFFCEVENLPALGHCVTILLGLALNGQSVELQSEALRTLDTLYFQLVDDGEILSYILPGNVSSLTKLLALPGSKSHFTVIVQALDLLGSILAKVYDDTELKVDFKEIHSLDDISADSFEFDHIQLEEVTFKKIHRTKSWLKATSSQVRLALNNVKRISAHDKYEVRHSLLQFSKKILSHCIYSLNSSLPIIVEMIAALSKDPRLNIDPQAVLFTENPKHQELISTVLSKELNTHVDTFMATLQSSNEDKILSNIASIKFLVQQGISQLVLHRIITSSIQEISDMVKKANSKTRKITNVSADISDFLLIASDVTNISIDEKSLNIYDQILSADTQQQLSNLFQTLGYQADPNDIIEDVLSESSRDFVERGVSLWVCNCLAQGYTERVKPVIVADEFLSFDAGDDGVLELKKPDFVYTILEYSKQLLDDASDIESSVQVIDQVSCVSLDAIGTITTLLRQDFEYELIDYLYPVIDALGSPSESIRNHAMNTSMIISDNLYSGSLYQLIYANTDYLVDAISFKLSNAVTQRTTAILAVCVRIAGYQIIESFKDVMEIVFSLLDNYHGYDDICVGFFLLFEIIADEIKRKYLSDSWLEKIEFDGPESSYEPWGMTNVNQVATLLDKKNREIHLQTPQEVNDEVEDEVGTRSDSDDEDDSLEQEQMEQLARDDAKWTSPVPKETYQLLQQITYYGERLLTHPSAKLHSQILRTYLKALPIFGTSKKHFLPIAASIWPLLSHYVNNSDPKIAILAADVMSLLIKFSGSFVAQRFVDLWRKLSKNDLLVTARTIESQQVILPGIRYKCYQSLVNMLLESLNTLGRYIPDSVSEEIVRSCIGMIEVERFQNHSDIAWILKREVFNIPNDTQKPKDVMIDGEVIHFPLI